MKAILAIIVALVGGLGSPALRAHEAVAQGSCTYGHSYGPPPASCLEEGTRSASGATVGENIRDEGDWGHLNASYSARAWYGDLSAASQADGLAIRLNTPGGPVDTRVSTDVGPGSFFKDSLTVSSTVLAAGTPVELRLVAKYQGSVTPGAFVFESTDDDFAYAYAAFFTKISIDTLSPGGGYAPFEYYRTCNSVADGVDCPGSDLNATFEMLVNARVGDTLEFMAQLSAGSGFSYVSNAEEPSNSLSMAVDAQHGLRTFVDPVTDGVTLAAASGHDYSLLAVPEPATALVWAAGLIGLGWRVGRR